MLLQHYQERWVDDFKEIKKVIREALLIVDVSIVHVGSTSVPKLAAKPIIDIDVVYGPGVEFNEVKDGLEKIGYYHNGNQGIKEREVFKRCKLTKKHRILDSISHHLYVCPIHSEEFNQHLLFRNFLIKNKRERQQYQEIKIQIAEDAKQDGKKYAHLKDVEARDFILSIIERAKKKK
jgi:GrpB-like predicted nucleotidyltransferase (UPF0157 family)